MLLTRKQHLCSHVLTSACVSCSRSATSPRRSSIDCSAETMAANTCFTPSIAALRPAARSRVAAKAAAKPVAVASSDAKEVSRRAALSLGAGAAALLASRPAQAAYGEAANVFGGKTNPSGFVPYAGDGYALLLPGKWNPSKEREFAGMDVRYEDNFDAVNNLFVVVKPAEKSKIEDYGNPDAFLSSTLVPYLGQQSWQGETKSEGGFAAGKVSTASLLTAGTTQEGGKTYYEYEVLTRTADGDEGGRHHVFKATVSGGKLYVLKIQAGDKRWFKGVEREAKKCAASFQVV